MSSLIQSIAILAASALFCFLISIYWYLRHRRQRKEENLRLRVLGQDAAMQSAGQGIQIRGAGLRGPAALASLPFVQNFMTAYAQSGITLPFSKFGWISFGSIMFIFIATLLFTQSLLSGIILAALTTSMLFLFVFRRFQHQIQLLEKQVPRALEMIIFALRAGHGLEEAIGDAASEIDPPLSLELRRTYDEYSMGKPLETGLLQLSERWPMVESLFLMVEIIVVLKKTGGNLLEVLETTLRQLRNRTAYEAKHRALTAEGKTSGMILMMLPIVILGVQALISPDGILSMTSSAGGQLALLASFLLWLMGTLWIFRLLRPS